MLTLMIAIAAGLGFIVAYHTYGKWLGSKIFRLSATAVCPSTELQDDVDFVPTPRSIIFGHHFTSIAGTGPIVGPAIAVMWGWLPAMLWVVFGAIFVGAVHDFGSLVVSLRNKGQSIGDVAGHLISPVPIFATVHSPLAGIAARRPAVKTTNKVAVCLFRKTCRGSFGVLAISCTT